MSLSKYFEKSDGFLPDKLVKNVEPNDQSWKPSATPANKPFAPEDLTLPTRHKAPEEPAVHHETAKKADAGQPVSPEQTVSKPQIAAAPPKKGEEQQAVATPPPAVPPSAPQPVDLSKYVDKKEAEKAIEEAYQRGCHDGRTGIEQDFVDATRMLISASQQIDNIRELLIANSSRELQAFALAIAEKILRISLREQDTTLIATIEEALTRAVKSDEFTVYVNPDDYELAVEKAPELITGISGLNNLVIKKDGTIERGGAKLESDNCTIDATVTSQLEIIREEIQSKL